MEDKIALIDGDIIVYKVAYEKAKTAVAEEATENIPFTSEGIPSSEEAAVERSWEEVKNSIDEFMLYIRNETATTHYIGFLSPPRKNNFRSNISTTVKYKGNRDDREIPRFFNEIKQYLVEAYLFQQLTSIETDDALAIIQTRILSYKEKEEDEEVTTMTVICSIDKDMLQVEGKHWNWKTGEFKIVTHDEAYKTLWTQVLTGDTTDNILGCGTKEEMVYKTGKKKGETYVARVGVGPKEAESIIAECGTLAVMPMRVLTEFINRYGLHQGINKYNEAFNLIFLLRTWPIFEAREGLYEFTPWINTDIIEEDDETF